MVRSSAGSGMPCSSALSSGLPAGRVRTTRCSTPFAASSTRAGVLSSSPIAQPLGDRLALLVSAGRPGAAEPAAEIEPMCPLVVALVRPQVDSPRPTSCRLLDDLVEHGSADTPPPAIGEDVDQAQE